MPRIRLIIQYDGTNYVGWQTQPNGIAVQEVIEKELEKLTGVRPTLHASGRTDSGVHALGFMATVEPRYEKDEITVPVDKIPIALNIKLPNDVSVLEAKAVDLAFHPRYDVKKKEYIYKIHDSKIPNPFYNNLVLEYGKEISDQAINRMNEACKYFLGAHEFDAFMAVGSKIENTQRTVFDAHVSRNGDIVEFSVTADGFLYNMVRIMVGTLLKVESGKLEPQSIREIILSKDRALAGFTAKPQGLYLKKVYY